MSETCPKCHSELVTGCEYTYVCGSGFVPESKEFCQSGRCRSLELEAQNTRLSAVLNESSEKGWEVLKVANAKVQELEQQLAAQSARIERLEAQADALCAAADSALSDHEEVFMPLLRQAVADYRGTKQPQFPATNDSGISTSSG